MSHYSTLGWGVRRIENEASLLFSAAEFAAFERRWIDPWTKHIRVCPSRFQESAWHRVHLVMSLAREARRKARLQREDLAILVFEVC